MTFQTGQTASPSTAAPATLAPKANEISTSGDISYQNWNNKESPEYFSETQPAVSRRASFQTLVSQLTPKEMIANGHNMSTMLMSCLFVDTYCTPS